MELIIKCTYSRRYTQILLICDEIHEKFGLFLVSLKQFTKRYVIEKHDEKKENNNARAL